MHEGQVLRVCVHGNQQKRGHDNGSDLSQKRRLTSKQIHRHRGFSRKVGYESKDSWITVIIQTHDVIVVGDIIGQSSCFSDAS